MTAARYWDEENQRWVFVSKSYPLPVEEAGGGGPVTIKADDITDATTVGKNVLRAMDAVAARTAIGAGTSSQNLSALTAAEATAGTVTTARSISAVVLAGAIEERTSNKAQIAALTPITDPAAADARAVATLLNSVIAALKAKV